MDLQDSFVVPQVMCFFKPDTIDINRLYHVVGRGPERLFQWLSVWYNPGILNPRKHIPYNFVLVPISGT